MRLVVLAPGLPRAEGHELEYTRALIAAALERRMEAVTLSRGPLALPGQVFAALKPPQPSPAGPARTVAARLARKLRRTLDDAARARQAHRLVRRFGGPAVRFVLHTASYPEMELWIAAFARASRGRALGRLSVVARSDHEEDPERMAQIRRAFSAADCGRIDVFCDSAALVRLLTPLAPVPLHEAPPPARVVARSARLDPRVACLGARRASKGFHLLPAGLTAARAALPTLTAFVQAYSHPDDAPDPACERALDALSGIDWVELETGTLPTGAYTAQLERACAVVLPYDPHIYRAGTSGVFVEAVAAGCAAVVPQGSWMAQEALAHGLSRVVICPDIEDARRLGAAIGEAVRIGREPWEPALGEARWLAGRTPAALLDVLCGG